MSAFYISNIENYLFRDGSFPRFIDNVKKLPHTDKSVIIRSLFGGYQLPESVPGYYSTSATQTINELLANCGITRAAGTTSFSRSSAGLQACLTRRSSKPRTHRLDQRIDAARAARRALVLRRADDDRRA